MKSKRVIFPALLIAVILAVGSYNPRDVSATGVTSSIVSRLAERFGLKEEEVQEFFVEMHGERHEEAQVKHDGYMDSLVADGLLTEGQREELEAIRAEMHDNSGDYSDLTVEELQTRHQEYKADIKAWAEVNDVSLKTVFKSTKHTGKSHHGGFGAWGK